MNIEMDEEPIKLTRELQSILIETGISEEEIFKLKKFYEKEFTEDVPVSGKSNRREALTNEQRKKKSKIGKRVEFLKVKLDQFNPKR